MTEIIKNNAFYYFLLKIILLYCQYCINSYW